MADSSTKKLQISATEQPSDIEELADTDKATLATSSTRTNEKPIDPDISPVGEPPAGEPSENLLATGKQRRSLWLEALQETFPTYLAVHIGFIVITIYAILFVLHDFQYTSLPLATLWNSWHRWDTNHYLGIAQSAYTSSKETAFFPFYPMLIRLFMVVIRNPFSAALVVTDLAGLGFLVVLYRLVRDELDAGIAQRTILYISIFPTAFFLAAAYTETTFLFFALLTFYNLRKGNWWYAGLFGLLTSLTRSTGLLLVLPFCYEYLLTHGFTFKKFPFRNLRLSFLAGLLIPLGTGLFALYCYLKFQDPLAFSHAEIHWTRSLHAPWFGIAVTIGELLKQPRLAFVPLRDLLDLGPDLLMLGLILLMFVGPWRLRIKDWSYAIFAVATYVFLLIEPVYPSPYPLQSTSRYMLAIFPAFILLARIGKHRAFHLHYVLISGALLFFMLTQFLTHHWIV